MNCRTFCICEGLHYDEFVVDNEVFNKFYEIVNPEIKPLIAIPDGCVDIQFTYRNGICKAYLTGSFSEGRESITGTYDRCFGIKFNAGFVSESLINSFRNIVDNRLPLNDHLWVAKLERALTEKSSFSLKISRFLDAYCDTGLRKNHDITDYIVYQIWKRSGHVKVADLIDKIGYAHCYVDRVFKMQTGMSVKKYAKIVRIQNAIHILYTKNSDEIYMDLGYYDQSHFIRDFKTYTTYTPNYIKTHHDVAIV